MLWHLPLIDVVPAIGYGIWSLPLDLGLAPILNLNWSLLNALVSALD